MSRHNTSDLIEAYLKKILENNEIIEIRRTEMADLFNCVPSQINYVINTRFTIQRGYAVESKRGGGGYIRIAKVKVSSRHHFLEEISQLVDLELSEKNAVAIIQKLYEESIITRKEGNLMLSVVPKNVLGMAEDENFLRAQIMQAFLKRLSYEEKE